MSREASPSSRATASRGSLPLAFLTAALALAAHAGPFSVSASAQTGAAAMIPAEQAHALFRDLRWRNIGPANMAGRIGAIDAVEATPAVVYMGAASGGVFRSINAGTTWQPVFENYGSANIGDVKIFQPDPRIVWVGTGEGCVRNSVGWGDGIYKSTDGGRTFTNMGLRESHHIDEILLHPTNPDIVWVAAQGHLWGYNEERGVFKTTDGGRTWRKLTNGLPDDDRTGANELVMDPTNPDVIYAGLWERIRWPYNFESGGMHGGIAGDFHALCIDPANGDRFYVGNDKGSYVTYDRGYNFIMFDNMDIGQFYAISVDNRDPYWVYGGLQDNGNWGGPSNSRDVNGIFTDHWFKFHAGDGFHATVDPDDWRTVYTESQGGAIRRLDAVFRQVGRSITPTPATVLNFSEMRWCPTTAARRTGCRRSSASTGARRSSSRRTIPASSTTRATISSAAPIAATPGRSSVRIYPRTIPSSPPARAAA